MKKLIFILLSLLIALGACKRDAEEVAAVVKEGPEFIIANGAEPETLDPHLVSGVPEYNIYMSLFEGLTTVDPKTAAGVPGLAESWEISDGGKTYTFKLRQAVWSDGEPITAETVRDSWLRMINPETATPYAWFPSMFIAGAAEYNGGKAGPEAVKIKAVDDTTFQMTMVGPLPYVTGALAHYAFAVVPLHAIDKHGKEWTNPENFVGNGPFLLDEWLPQEKVSVVPNPKYWNADIVKLGRVTYLPIDDLNTAHTLYLNGEADWSRTVPLDQIDAVKLRADYQNSPYLGTYYYTFQTQSPPFDDVRVRKALTMAIDRKSLTDKITKAGQLPAPAFVPSGMAGYTGIKGTAESVERAKQLLADAGYPGGDGFPTFEILYNTSDNHKKIAEYVQQEWKENLGIECTLANQEWKTYLANRRAGEFQVARAGWIGDYQDPNTFLDMFVTGGAMNGGQYTNKQFDEAIHKAATMDAGSARMEVLRQAEQVFIEQDQAVMPIYYYVRNNMIDLDKWGGWHMNLMDYHPPQFIYKK